MATVLIADDDAAIRMVVGQALSRVGFDILATGTAAGLWNWVAAGEGDCVVTDVVMPDENGLDLIPRIKKLRPDLPVIVMSAQNTLATAVKATESGAYDYLPKPFDIKELVRVVRASLAQTPRPTPAAEHEESGDELPLIGRSPAMQEVYRVVARVVPTDLTVMISGESGTGKELVARALHRLGKRRAGPFVPVNMAAIPKDLIESELFGHEKGAFTGANARMVGRFEQAQGGTLFLDEIGDMPADAQTRLLRVLQEGEFSSVGGRNMIKADVRIVAATNKDLRSLINQGLFREDLFYRLNVIPLRVPPLRERLDDIPALVRHFLSEAAAAGLPRKSFDAAALEWLRHHVWPGNVRELENLVRRLVALSPEDVIGSTTVEAEFKGIPPVTRASDGEGLGQSIERHLARYFAGHGDHLPPDGLYDRILVEIERPLLTLCLAATRGNQLRAARLLGLNRNTLRKKLRQLGIDQTKLGG